MRTRCGSMAASFTVPSGDKVTGSRKRSGSSDQDNNLSRHQRRRKSLKPRQNRKIAISSSTSEISSPIHHHQKILLKSQSLLYSAMGTIVTDESAQTEADKRKKLLEWELSTLGAEDLRSHAWYHGGRVDRIEAERLLRQCVAEEYGFSSTSTCTTSANNAVISPKEDTDELGSDGLEDVSSVSSESDFALDDFLDGLVDESGNVSDPFTATTTVMAASVLLQQRHRMSGVLPTKRPRHPKRNRRNYYCFLVRDSTNVRPPGRYVVSCLRVDKYDVENNEINKLHNQASNIIDEEKRKKFLRRQLQRRQRRQQRRPVLHFVINEIILQPGTVYERSQFTFGNTLPNTAATMSSNAATSSNNGLQYQPGFDSVPHLIRYYVGGADDNAVLSYGVGNDGATGINSMLPQLTHTEVRIRYPCNRRCPLANVSSIDEIKNLVFVPAVTDQKQKRQYIPASLTESMKVSSSNSMALEETQHTSHWRQLSSSFRSSNRKTPSATVTSATAYRPISSTELTFTGLSSSSTLPRSLTSSTGPSKIPTHSLSSVSSLSAQSLSTATLPKSFTTSRPQGSRSSSASKTSNTSSRSTTSSSVSTLSSIAPHASASDLIISTSTGALTLAQRSSITVSLNNQPPKNKETSPLKNEKLRIPDKSLQFHDTPDFLDKSINSIHDSNANKCEESRIDIDAEIAAALSAVGDEGGTPLDEMFDDPYPVGVRSSFARVNIDNDLQGRLGSHQIGSRTYQTRDRQSRFDGYKGMPENNNIIPSDHSVICSNQSIECPSNNNYDINYHQLERPPLLPFPKNLSSLLDAPSLMPPPPPPPLPLDLGMKLMDHKQSYEHFKYQNRDDKNIQHHKPQKIGQAGRKLDFGNTEGVESFLNEGEAFLLQHPTRTRSKLRQNREGEEQTLKEWADLEIERLISDGRMNPDQDSDMEKETDEPTEFEDFEMWRNRFSSSVRHRYDGTPEQRRKDRLNRRRSRLMEARNEELWQRRLYLQNKTLGRSNRVRGFSETGFSDYNTQDQMTNETLATRSFYRSSDIDGIVEKMINRWIGVPQSGNSASSIQPATVIYEANNETNTMKQPTATRRQSRKPPSSTQTSGEYLASLENDKQQTEKYLHRTQVNRMTIDSQGDTANVINTSKSNTTETYVSTVNTDTGTFSPEIDNGSNESDTTVNKPVSDYENINPLNDNLRSSSDDINSDHHNDTNEDDNTLYDDKKYCSSMDNSNNSNSSQDISTAEGVDYENVVSHIDNNDEIVYENVGKDNINLRNQEKRQKLISDDSGGGASVATALRAVHLAIIGDPKDGSKSSSVAGTGRLAAALCNADGRATVLPYRNCVENEIEENSMGSCPLQLLGQPGPEGRRARLDVIERFACLQYLVAMTVIVTPCLLLIGNNTKTPDEHVDWSLEDEYEYQRRKFYYRCAGIGDWYFSGTDSDSDDDDNQLSAESAFNTGYMLPPKEEWAIEKRHWLDLLTQHRAIALDKWIRIAADTKQAVGDVYGYRALMSALCSDRIQTLRDAWATLRRLHTATAVTFESRLRPEFLGRRDKHISAGGDETAHDFNEEYDNDVDVLLQLPPNATIPDATALAVLYEHLYNDADYGASFSFANEKDNNSMEDKNPRPSSLFTSPLLLSPSPWSSTNSGISSGLGASVTADYGLQALHILCVQYSEWVQQNCTKKKYTKSTPMLQLDRFRNNFQTLLRQYAGSGYDDNNQYDYDSKYIPSYKQNKENIVSCNNESTYNRDDTFEYERHYEDKVEEYGICGGNYDDCADDDDDDDATVICCGNSSRVAINMVNFSTNIITDATDMAAKSIAEKEPRQTSTKDHDCLRREYRDQEEFRWIKDLGVYGPAPLNIVFRTELHVRLFWPSTLYLTDENPDSGDDNNDTVQHQLAVPAYALGTTYLALAATAHYSIDKAHSAQPPKMLDQVINEQLNRVAHDMRLRYKAMDKFLDGACTYSKVAAKLINADIAMTGNQHQTLRK